LVYEKYGGMFEVINVTNNNVLLNHIYVFNDKTSCKIFPNLGASIQELSFDNNSILDGIEISSKGVLDYQNTFKSSLLFPFPGRIEDGKYGYNDQSFQLNQNDFSNLNAIHGLVSDKHFKLALLETTEERAKVVLSYLSDGKSEGFPYKFQLIVTYLISNKNFQLSIDVKNLGLEQFPFGLGWHPYFKSGNQKKSKLSFYSEEQLVCNEYLIPKSVKKNTLNPIFTIENQFFDDTFILSKKKVIFETEKYILDMIFSDTSEAWLQIFTPEHRKSIAIEPMSCSPNVFNSGNGLKILSPNETFLWHVGLNYRTGN
jgi:aldose 1-epimerase